MHDLSLITTIAAAFTAAWVLGLFTQWLKLSPIVGYLLAGILIGPYTPGFVGDVGLATQLAEVGVILLMFGVGLHFHLKDLMAVKGVAIPGAVGQSLVATLVAVAVFAAFGMPVKTGIVLGMAMAVASTVVLMRVLMDADVLNTTQGHVAVGWLIVEDIFTVILLVLIPILGNSGGGEAVSLTSSSFWITLGNALLKLAALVALVFLAGVRLVPWVLVRVARLRSRELFTLTILVFSVAIAAGAYVVFGASMALGAFLAGMVVAQSPVSHQAAADALPMRDAFAVIFFVSVGMLFDPSFLVQEPLMVLAALGIILLVKPLAALVIVALLGYSARTALTVAIGLAQIGEFSFILSDLAKQHGLMSAAGHNVLVAAAILSITLNPLLFRSLPKTEAWLRTRPFLWRILNARAESKALRINQSAVTQVEEVTGRLAIVAGYGPVGRTVHQVLKDAGLSTVVIDMNMETVSALNAAGQQAIFGDASHESILEQAGTRRASHFVLTLPDASSRAAVVAAARSLNASMRILVRARYLNEREELERTGASVAVFEEAESAIALARLVLADTGLHREAAERKILDLRLQLIMENMTNIRSQRVGSVMVPWSRVRTLSTAADSGTVLRLVSQDRFSRWPVIDATTSRAKGYLLTKDLLAHDPGGDWLGLIRPLQLIHPDQNIDATLTRMQSENAAIYLVDDGTRHVGLVTMEDILEQVVGRLEDEDPHEVPLTLEEAVARGAIVMPLEANTLERAIGEMLEAVPAQRFTGVCGREDILKLVMDREQDLSTDLGNGFAIPHARCAALEHPFVVIARSSGGILFPGSTKEPVTWLFLIVTPAEHPEAQLALLSQLARIASKKDSRAALQGTMSPADLMDLLHRHAPAPPGQG